MTDTSMMIATPVAGKWSDGHSRSKSDETSRPSTLGTIHRALPWLVVAAALVAALIWTGTPVAAILRYGAYWAAGVVVPGTLVYRALRGSRGNLPEDVGFGAVTGFAVQLIGWALFVGTGLGGWLRVWPVLVVAPFLAVPGLRRHWSLRSPEPMRLTSSWAIAGVMLVGLAPLALTSWINNPLPPATHTLFGDLYYHWANAAELRRTITPQQPQMAGEPLVYHWFSDAYRASASMLSGAPLSTVLLRLWAGPVVVTTTLVIAGLGRQVSRVWWGGPAATFIAMVVPTASIWPAFETGSFTMVSWGSPTLMFSIPVVAAVVSLLVDIAWGVRLGGGWLLLAVLLPLATASKSSSLPVLLGGIALACLASWLIHRRPPWMLMATGAAGLLLLAVTAPILAGGGPGASLQFGAGLTFTPAFRWLATVDYVPGTGGLWPTAWLHMPWSTRWALFALVLCLLFGQIGRIAGFGALLLRPMRRDVAVWLLAGIGFAGWGGALLINHVANGEGYFAYSAVPAESALTAWLLATVAPGRRRALVVIAGFALGGVTAALLERSGPGGDHLDGGIPSGGNPGGGPAQWAVHWRSDLMLPFAALAAVLAAGALIWWLVRLRWRAALAGTGAAILVAAAVGMGVDATYRSAAGWIGNIVDGKTTPDGYQGSFWVTKDEMRAAQWLARHAPTDDILATNVHCEYVTTTPLCVSRSFWVSGITEHAVVLEGWAYQPAAMVRHGENGRPYYQQPAPDGERRRINDAAFTDPTPEVLAQLRARYHAKWLFADTRAGRVSPRLATLATERYRSGTVIVYELAG